MQWATPWENVCRNIYVCTHVWKKICIYLHLHVCKTPTKHVVKKGRDIYTEADSLYIYIFCYCGLKKTWLFMYITMVEKKILASTNYLFHCQSSYYWQFLCLSSFTGLLPISLKESLSWIHERQKTKLKLLRLWSPFDLSSNPNPATSSLWNHGSITYLLWAQFSLQQNAGNENLPPHRCNED